MKGIEGLDLSGLAQLRASDFVAAWGSPGAAGQALRVAVAVSDWDPSQRRRGFEAFEHPHCVAGEKEHHYRDDQERDDVVDKLPVHHKRLTTFYRSVYLLRCRIHRNRPAQIVELRFKIDTARRHADERHDDPVRKSLNDSAERCAEDDRDCEIEYVAACDECFEITPHGLFTFLRCCCRFNLTHSR